MGNLEAVVLRKQRGFLIPVELLQRRSVFLVMDIRETFEEQQRKDVGLEVRRIHRPTQDVCSFPEVRFELGNGNDGHELA